MHAFVTHIIRSALFCVYRQKQTVGHKFGLNSIVDTVDGVMLSHSHTDVLVDYYTWLVIVHLQRSPMLIYFAVCTQSLIVKWIELHVFFIFCFAGFSRPVMVYMLRWATLNCHHGEWKKNLYFSSVVDHFCIWVQFIWQQQYWVHHSLSCLHRSIDIQYILCISSICLLN